MISEARAVEKVEPSFLAGLGLMAAELSSFSLHLVRILFYLFFLTKRER